MRETIPLAFFCGVDASAGVVIEQPGDVAAGVEGEIGVVAGSFVPEEDLTAVGNHLDEFVRGDDSLQALLADGFVFRGHESSLAGSYPGGDGGVWCI